MLFIIFIMSKITPGFRRPIALRKEIIEFFKKANLGNDEEGKPIKDKLYFVKDNHPLYCITDCVTLTIIFSVYVKVNNLSKLSTYNQDVDRQREHEYKDPLIFGADSLMMEYFEDIFNKITMESQQKLLSMGVSDKQPKPQPERLRKRKYYRDGTKHPIWKSFYHVFDFNNFTYGDFQSIISHIIDKKHSLNISKELQEMLDDLYTFTKKDMQYIEKVRNY
jgi:hypothetical protein